jgi:hypothetical protein
VARELPKFAIEIFLIVGIVNAALLGYPGCCADEKRQ